MRYGDADADDDGDGDAMRCDGRRQLNTLMYVSCCLVVVRVFVCRLRIIMQTFLFGASLELCVRRRRRSLRRRRRRCGALRFVA